MTFAFDFDGMLTACPDLWVPTMQLAQTQGHTVVIATGRSDRDGSDSGVLAEFCSLHGLKDVAVYFCGSRPKRQVLAEAGVFPDAWVDDNPVMVDFGYEGLDRVGEYHAGEKR